MGTGKGVVGAWCYVEIPREAFEVEFKEGEAKGFHEGSFFRAMKRTDLTSVRITVDEFDHELYEGLAADIVKLAEDERRRRRE